MEQQQQKAINTAYFSMFGNLLLAITKGLIGFFGNSFALIADAIESSADVFSSFLVLFGLKYAKRPPDENHPYGHGKVEPLITFVVVGFLCASATVIVVESIHNIRTPHKIPQSYTLWFLGGIILIKEFSYRFVAKKSKETGSQSLKADAWHHRSDAITSLCAFVGISLALWKGNSWAQADDWAALVSAVFIYVNAFLIFRPALGEIMDEHLHHDFIDKIREICAEVPRVIRTEKCMVRKSGMRFWVDIHVHVDGNLSVHEGHTIAHNLKSHLMEMLPEIEDVLVHIEPA